MMLDCGMQLRLRAQKELWQAASERAVQVQTQKHAWSVQGPTGCTPKLHAWCFHQISVRLNSAGQLVLQHQSTAAIHVVPTGDEFQPQHAWPEQRTSTHDQHIKTFIHDMQKANINTIAHNCSGCKALRWIFITDYLKTHT
jgi:hypothetical protein